MHEKVQAIVQIAQQHGIDPSRVETVSVRSSNDPELRI